MTSFVQNVRFPCIHLKHTRFCIKERKWKLILVVIDFWILLYTCTSQIRCTQLYIYMYAFYPIHCIQCINIYLKISVDIWLIYYFIALGIYSFFLQWACTDFKYSLKSLKLNLLTLHSAFQVRVSYLPYSEVFFCIYTKKKSKTWCKGLWIIMILKNANILIS